MLKKSMCPRYRGYLRVLRRLRDDLAPATTCKALGFLATMYSGKGEDYLVDIEVQETGNRVQGVLGSPG